MYEEIIEYFLYFKNFGLGINYFFRLINILAIFGGVLIGIIGGSIPGISITMCVALTLPFAFTMEPLTALSLLLSVYVGAIYGGSISAILLNTPGTPAAACTCMDGFKLSQNGKAGKALQIANWSSCIGDLVSTSFVILLAPLLAKVALYFGSPEYFALILFSVTIVASLAGKSMIKGILSGLLGFLIATIGMDPFVGSPRFTFGTMQLMNGFSLVPLLIGIFAIPEVLFQINQSRKMKGKANISFIQSKEPTDKKMTRTDFKRCLPHMIRGGLIGLVIGIIPGLGATPAAFISYDRAKKASKYSNEFGNGSIEGVAAAEAGNNGVNGATLLPLLTLGIPGDIITAIMLGAFMIFGLTPGPVLFLEHIDLIFGLFCALIMCDIALRVVATFYIYLAQKITQIPTSFVFPIIVILCVFGSYSINNNIFDIFTMIAFGIFGYFLLQLEIPTIPFLIAFILAPMFERGLRRSLEISNGNPIIFIKSPIAIIFYILTIISIIAIIKTKYKK